MRNDFAFTGGRLPSLLMHPVVLKLRRPIVARIATLIEWPLILIDELRPQLGGQSKSRGL